MSETKNKKSVWETMSAIDIAPYIKEKNGQKYLPWSRALALLKERYPDAYTEEVLFPTEKFISCLRKDGAEGKEFEVKATTVQEHYTIANDSCIVKTVLKIPSEGIEEYCTLPILDFKNKPVSPNNVTSDQINKAQRRCEVKGIARATGLGIGLWHDEVVSEAAEAQKILDKLDRQDAAQDAIAKFKKKVADGYDRTKLAEWLASNFGVNNPAKIKDDKVLAKLSEMLDKLDVKDFQSEKKTTAKKESK